MPDNELDKFLEDLDVKKPTEALDRETEVEVESSEKEEDNSEEFSGNRRTRRMAQKAQQYKEEAIALNARLQALAEADKVRTVTEESDFLKMVEPIFGTDTPEKREATELLKKALKGAHDSAEKSALEKALQSMDVARETETKQIAEEEDNIEEGIEMLEDEYNIDLSPGSKERTNFLTLLERLSPKDKEGNIVEYADFDATYEIYERNKEKASSRAKELASRSMARSGSSSGGSKLEKDAAERYLRDIGVL